MNKPLIRHKNQPAVSQDGIMVVMRIDEVVKTNIGASRYSLVFVYANRAEVRWEFKSSAERDMVESSVHRFLQTQDIFIPDSES